MKKENIKENTDPVAANFYLSAEEKKLIFTAIVKIPLALDNPYAEIRRALAVRLKETLEEENQNKGDNHG